MGERERAPPPRTQTEEAAAPLGKKENMLPRRKWRPRSRGCPEMMVSRSLRKARVNNWVHGPSETIFRLHSLIKETFFYCCLSAIVLNYRGLIMFQAIRFTARMPLRSVRWSSTGPVLPPLMTTMRNDLKTAMRAKDISRYSMLTQIFLYWCCCLLFGRSFCCLFLSALMSDIQTKRPPRPDRRDEQRRQNFQAHPNGHPTPVTHAKAHCSCQGGC